jgi:putative transposase
MDTQKIATEYRLSQWAQIIQARKNPVSETKEVVASGWVRLRPAKPQYADGGILIEINDCQITVKSNTDLELLKNVCSVLRSLSITSIAVLLSSQHFCGFINTFQKVLFYSRKLVLSSFLIPLILFYCLLCGLLVADSTCMS